MSDAKYINDWIRNNKDTLRFQVRKGQKEVIEAHWKGKGYKSLNQYIIDLLKADGIQLDDDLRADAAPETEKKDLPDPGIKVAAR